MQNPSNFPQGTTLPNSPPPPTNTTPAGFYLVNKGGNQVYSRYTQEQLDARNADTGLTSISEDPNWSYGGYSKSPLPSKPLESFGWSSPTGSQYGPQLVRNSQQEKDLLGTSGSNSSDSGIFVTPPTRGFGGGKPISEASFNGGLLDPNASKGSGSVYNFTKNLTVSENVYNKSNALRAQEGLDPLESVTPINVISYPKGKAIDVSESVFNRSNELRAKEGLNPLESVVPVNVISYPKGNPITVSENVYNKSNALRAKEGLDPLESIIPVNVISYPKGIPITLSENVFAKSNALRAKEGLSPLESIVPVSVISYPKGKPLTISDTNYYKSNALRAKEGLSPLESVVPLNITSPNRTVSESLSFINKLPVDTRTKLELSLGVLEKPTGGEAVSFLRVPFGKSLGTKNIGTSTNNISETTLTDPLQFLPTLASGLLGKGTQLIERTGIPNAVYNAVKGGGKLRSNLAESNLNAKSKPPETNSSYKTSTIKSNPKTLYVIKPEYTDIMNIGRPRKVQGSPELNNYFKKLDESKKTLPSKSEPTYSIEPPKPEKKINTVGDIMKAKATSNEFPGTLPKFSTSQYDLSAGFASGHKPTPRPPPTSPLKSTTDFGNLSGPSKPKTFEITNPAGGAPSEPDLFSSKIIGLGTSESTFRIGEIIAQGKLRGFKQNKFFKNPEAFGIKTGSDIVVSGKLRGFKQKEWFTSKPSKIIKDYNLEENRYIKRESYTEKLNKGGGINPSKSGAGQRLLPPRTKTEKKKVPTLIVTKENTKPLGDLVNTKQKGTTKPITKTRNGILNFNLMQRKSMPKFTSFLKGKSGQSTYPSFKTSLSSFTLLSRKTQSKQTTKSSLKTSPKISFKLTSLSLSKQTPKQMSKQTPLSIAKQVPLVKTKTIPLEIVKTVPKETPRKVTRQTQVTTGKTLLIPKFLNKKIKRKPKQKEGYTQIKGLRINNVFSSNLNIKAGLNY